MKVRERHFIFLLTVIFGFNIALVFYAFGPHEPEYQKKRLGAWLEDLDYSRPSFRREAVPQAEDAVRQIGTDAVPCLIRMMRSYDSPLKKKLVALCSKQSFVRLNFGLPADKLQWRGALGIYVLGPDGKEAIPELMNLLTNQHAWIRGRAAMALGKIGPAAKVALPFLIKALGDADADVRACTCAGLSELGSEAAEALPALVNCLKETNHTVFSLALAAVSRIDGRAALVVPVLSEKLRDHDSRIRYAAATALATFGSEARAAVPALVEAIKDADKDVRDAAARALGGIDSTAAADAGVNVAKHSSPNRAEANISINFNSVPVAQVLEFYKTVSGSELVAQVDLRFLPGLVTLRPTRPLSKAEAVQTVEQALLEQAGVVIERLDDKRVSVKPKQSVSGVGSPLFPAK